MSGKRFRKQEVAGVYIPESEPKLPKRQRVSAAGDDPVRFSNDSSSPVSEDGADSPLSSPPASSDSLSHVSNEPVSNDSLPASESSDSIPAVPMTRDELQQQLLERLSKAAEEFAVEMVIASDFPNVMAYIDRFEQMKQSYIANTMHLQSILVEAAHQYSQEQ